MAADERDLAFDEAGGVEVEPVSRIPPDLPQRTLCENSTRCGVISAQCPGERLSATRREWVTSQAELSEPCSASISRSSAARPPWTVSSAKMIDPEGPAGRPGSMTPARRRFAATTSHQFYNREWLDDDSLWPNAAPTPPVLARIDHERILTAYGCAFFRAVLLNHLSCLDYLEGKLLPAGVSTQNVHLAFERDKVFNVDNHEDGNGIGQNSLAGC